MQRVVDLVDEALEKTVLLSFSRVGYAVRHRLEDWAPLPRLDGRVCAVTGASSGLGFTASLDLARLGARLRLLVRDEGRGDDARARLTAGSGNEDIRVELVDLASLTSVRECAQRLRDCGEPLHVLVNNAGILPPERRESADGIELTLATNVVGPFLLTNLLAPLLVASAPARVINVSSGGMYTARLADDDPEMELEPFDGVRAYARSKRGEVVLTELWSQRLSGLGVTVNAMHPGWAATPGITGSIPTFSTVMRPLLRPPEQGADTIVWLAAGDEGGQRSGLFWLDRRPRATHRLRRTRETTASRTRFWDRCCELAGWREPPGWPRT